MNSNIVTNMHIIKKIVGTHLLVMVICIASTLVMRGQFLDNIITYIQYHTLACIIFTIVFHIISLSKTQEEEKEKFMMIAKANLLSAIIIPAVSFSSCTFIVLINL